MTKYFVLAQDSLSEVIKIENLKATNEDAAYDEALELYNHYWNCLVLSEIGLSKLLDVIRYFESETAVKELDKKEQSIH